MFNAIYQGEHGPTVSVDDPKVEAYKHAAYIQNVLKQRYSLTSRPDGTYTVTGEGVESLTFEKIEKS